MSVMLSLGVLIASSTLAFGQAPPEQSLIEQDIAYGFALHRKVVESNTVISEGEALTKLQSVFDGLKETTIMRSDPSGMTHQVFYLRGSPVNAYATGGGRVYVTEGLMNAIQGNRGLLAFILGHEVAHNYHHHGVRKYLRAVEHDRMTHYYAGRCRAGDKASCWANIAYQTAFAIAEKKLERDEEHEADRLGLMLAAEAGYHPDFAILMARAMREKVGDQSKFGAFFSNHPRWKTREDRANENYEAALHVFQQRWPALDQSPGGVPPILVVFGPLSSSRAAKEKVYQVNSFARVRNVRSTVRLRMDIVSDKPAPPLVIWQQDYAGDSAQTIAASVRESSLKGRKGKQFIHLVALDEAGRILAEADLKKLK